MHSKRQNIKQLLVIHLIGIFLFYFYTAAVFANDITNLKFDNNNFKIVKHYSCTVNDGNSFLMNLWGKPAPEFRVSLGLWSFHTSNKKRNGHNDLFGFSYKSYFAGTLVNSYYTRAYAVGIQRYWIMKPLYNSINYEMGYRLGLVSGYQSHNVVGLKILKNSPVIPFVQFLIGLNWKFLGWEISAPNPSVISTGFYIRF